MIKRKPTTRRARAPKEKSSSMVAVAAVFSQTQAHFVSLRDRYERASAPSLSIKEQMFLFKRLAFLIKAGVPLLEGLGMVKDQAATRRYGRVADSVINDVANGTTLAKSLGRFPRVFGDFGINIIKVGESSGTLSQNLDHLADELQKRQNLKQKIVSAFVYPAVITVATLGITGFLILYLFPKIMPVFTSLHMELPLTTKIVIAVSMFLQQWGLLVLILLVIGFIALGYALRKSEQLRFVYDAWLLRLPVIGSMFRSYNLSNACRTLGLLLKSGVNLSEAIPLTSDTTQNLVYKRQYRLLSEAIHRGERVSTHLSKNTHLFPSVMSQMISVGERSGSLSTTLIYLAELYETEVDDFTKNLSALIEPALMITMGIVVGFIAISIITPIYGITQNLHA